MNSDFAKLLVTDTGAQVLAFLSSDEHSGWPEVRFYYCRYNGSGYAQSYSRGYQNTESGWADAYDFFLSLDADSVIAAIPVTVSMLSPDPFAKVFSGDGRGQVAVMRTVGGAHYEVRFFVCPGGRLCYSSMGFGDHEHSFNSAQHFLSGAGPQTAVIAVESLFDTATIVAA